MSIRSTSLRTVLLLGISSFGGLFSKKKFDSVYFLCNKRCKDVYFTFSYCDFEEEIASRKKNETTFLAL